MWSRATSPEFLKPFLLLNLILNIGLEWAGFPVLAFYMHTILSKMKIPFNVYWVAVALAGYRSFLTVSLSFIMYRVKTGIIVLESLTISLSERPNNAKSLPWVEKLV